MWHCQILDVINFQNNLTKPKYSKITRRYAQVSVTYHNDEVILLYILPPMCP